MATVDASTHLCTTATLRSQLSDAFRRHRLAGIRGDWLENADLTCETLITQRRKEIIQMYRDGTMDRNGMMCASLATDNERATPG